MITKLLVLQQIIGDHVKVTQIDGKNFQWTFHARRSRLPDDPSFFPFRVNGQHEIWEREAGDETRLVVKENEIIFCDDYGVSGGTVIGILFPKNYVPDVVKFKDAPYIPVGVMEVNISTTPPGNFRVLYNYQEKRSAVVFNIHEDILFGFKCIARKVDDEVFPHNESLHADHLFDISISREFLNVEIIQNEDLQIINRTLENTDITQIKDNMNALLEALRTGDSKRSKSLLSKLSSYFNTAAGTTSALVTIADSYKGGNTVFSFIHKIIEYAIL